MSCIEPVVYLNVSLGRSEANKSLLSVFGSGVL